MRVSVYSRKAIESIIADGKFPENTAVISFCDPELKHIDKDYFRVDYTSVCDDVFYCEVDDLDLDYLPEKGYTYEEICAVRERITREYAEATSRERQLYRELKTGKGLLKEMETEDKTQRQTKGEIDGTERREEQETQRQGDRGVSAENEKITL